MTRSLVLLALLLAAGDPVHADPIPGREVDTGPGVNPVSPSFAVGADASGNIVAAINDEFFYNPGFSDEIIARRFDANGTALGADFQVNTHTTDQQFRPTVAVDAAGSFVIAWASQNQDGDGTGIFARRFSSSGSPLSGEFQVNTYTTGIQRSPAAAPLPGGGFVVVWESTGQDGSGFGVFGQRFDAAGAPLGGEFQVNTYTTGDQSAPAVVGGPGGSFVVTWSGAGVEEPADPGIFMQRFDGTGAPLGPATHVNTSAPNVQDDPAIAMDASGRSVVAWVDTNPGPLATGKDIVARRFNATGAPIGPDFVVKATKDREEFPAVGMDSTTGAFVILYQSPRGDGHFPGVGNVFGHRYDAAGVSLGTDFQVNVFLFDQQTPAGVVLDGTGAFTTVWVGLFSQAPGLRTRIVARRYVDPNAVPVAGKRLSILDTTDPSHRRLVFQAKDPTILTTVGVSANPVADGAVLHVFNGNGSGESACLALPSSGWTASGPAEGRTYVYADPDGVHGPCFRATFRGGPRGVVKAVCRGTQQPLPYSLDEPTQGSVAVSFTSGGATYCTRFGGTVVVDSGTVGKFSAKNPNPPATCPVPPAPCP